MSVPASAFTIGGIRVPALLAGVTVSIAAHAGMIGAMALIDAGHSHPATAPPVPEFALGEPIRVRLVTTREVTPDEFAQPARTPQVTSESNDRADAVVGDRPAPPDAAAVAHWQAIGEALLAVQRSTLLRPPAAPDARQASTERRDERKRASAAAPSAPAPSPDEREGAGASDAHLDAAADPPPPARAPVPRGIDRGVAVIDLPQPVYPRRSVRLGQEGTAVVAVTVGADGRVQRAVLRQSSGHRLLDEAALDAARVGRFRPALRDGRPIAATVLVPFEFELTQQRR